jgi:hypothetical protein
MVMTDLELHRDRELVDLKGRMANSITQFTRGLIKRESIDKQRAIPLPQTPRRITRSKGPDGWMKKSSTVDEEKDPHAGVMAFYDLEAVQKRLDTAPPDVSSAVEDETERSSTDGNESDSTDMNLEEIDLKAMYRYACRLMRETLDVEGVCFVDIDGIDWKHALAAPGYRDDQNPDTHTSGQSRRAFGSASSILGYSHSGKFGANQRENWQSIARWDEEAETSNPESRNNVFNSRHAAVAESAFMDPEFPSQTGHSAEDASYVSARTGSQFDDGGFSNHFLAEFIRDNPFGKMFNDGLPDELQGFLPRGVISAILVPIYDFDQNPFAMTCAYSSSKHRKFLKEEKRYLEVIF